MSAYRVQRTDPTVYIGPAGNAINGFKVTVYLPEFDETHLVNVENLDPKTVKPVIEKLLADRQALSSLGDEETDETE